MCFVTFTFVRHKVFNFIKAFILFTLFLTLKKRNEVEFSVEHQYWLDHKTQTVLSQFFPFKLRDNYVTQCPETKQL